MHTVLKCTEHIVLTQHDLFKRLSGTNSPCVCACVHQTTGHVLNKIHSKDLRWKLN